jgi:hypothetical protein
LKLPINVPFAPMETCPCSRSSGDEWQYEPKWDGFSCLFSKDEVKKFFGIRTIFAPSPADCKKTAQRILMSLFQRRSMNSGG